MTTRKKRTAKPTVIEEVLLGNKELFKALLKESLQEVLEAEMTAAVGAAPGERTVERLGYRSGYYARGLVTRVGKLELRVPRDRDGRFSTELFERYQRSEKALVAALAGCRRARRRRSRRSCAVTVSRRAPSARSTRAWTSH
jgi:transposase-like protein